MDKANAEALMKRYTPKQLSEIKTDRQVGITRFSPCGKYLLAGGYDATVKRWDFSGEEPKELPAVKGHHGWVVNLAFAPKGDFVFTADTWGEVRAWEYADKTPNPRWKHSAAHDGWIRSLALSRDGRLLATGGKDRTVRVWSATDGKLVREFDGHKEEVTCVAIHPDGDSVVSGDFNGTVKHWSLKTGGHVRDIDASSMHFHHRIQDVCGLRILQWHDDGKTLLCAGSKPTKSGRAFGTPTILLYDWKTGKLTKSLEQGESKDGYIFDLAWHPDGFFMIVTSGTPGSGKLMFRRIEDGQPFFTHKKMSNCHSLAVHPDGKRILVAATNRRSQGNGAVLDKAGNYLGNSSPLYLFEIPQG